MIEHEFIVNSVAAASGYSYGVSCICDWRSPYVGATRDEVIREARYMHERYVSKTPICVRGQLWEPKKVVRKTAEERSS